MRQLKQPSMVVKMSIAILVAVVARMCVGTFEVYI